MRGHPPPQQGHLEVLLEDRVQKEALQPPLQMLAVPEAKTCQHGHTLIVIPARQKHSW